MGRRRLYTAASATYRHAESAFSVRRRSATRRRANIWRMSGLLCADTLAGVTLPDTDHVGGPALRPGTVESATLDAWLNPAGRRLSRIAWGWLNKARERAGRSSGDLAVRRRLGLCSVPEVGS